MKKNDENRLSMMRATLLHLDANTFIWGKLEPFVEASNDLRQVINDCWTSAEIQLRGSKGVSTSRILLEEKVINRVLFLARITKSFAITTGNVELRYAVRYGWGRLIIKSQTDLISTLRNMVDAASPYADALVRYGIKPGEYKAAHGSITALEQKQSEVRRAISNKKAVTTRLPVIMKAGNSALARIDNLMHIFKPEHPEFVAGYKSARKIIHTGIRHKRDETEDAASDTS